MAPCYDEDDGGSTARTQIMIILDILCVCVIIVIMRLCNIAGKEFEEINTFYQGLEGRKLLIKEKKLVSNDEGQEILNCKIDTIV